MRSLPQTHYFISQVYLLWLAGSSAGAGSEVFHVYRHLRRRENIRQQWISEMAEKDDKEVEFQEKLASNLKAAEERTAKKRAKRCTGELFCIVWKIHWTKLIFAEDLIIIMICTISGHSHTGKSPKSAHSLLVFLVLSREVPQLIWSLV